MPVHVTDNPLHSVALGRATASRTSTRSSRSCLRAARRSAPWRGSRRLVLVLLVLTALTLTALDHRPAGPARRPAPRRRHRVRPARAGGRRGRALPGAARRRVRRRRPRRRPPPPARPLEGDRARRRARPSWRSYAAQGRTVGGYPVSVGFGRRPRSSAPRPSTPAAATASRTQTVMCGRAGRPHRAGRPPDQHRRADHRPGRSGRRPARRGAALVGLVSGDGPRA